MTCIVCTGLVCSSVYEFLVTAAGHIIEPGDPGSEVPNPTRTRVVLALVSLRHDSDDHPPRSVLLSCTMFNVVQSPAALAAVSSYFRRSILFDPGLRCGQCSSLT
jgi:hypothetical protein